MGHNLPLLACPGEGHNPLSSDKGERESERETEIERQRQTETDRQRDREIDRQRQREVD